MNKYIIAVVMSIALLGMSNLLYAAGLELELFNYKKIYEGNEDVRVSVQIRNNSSNDVVLPVFFIPEDFYIRFIIKDKNGNNVAFIGEEYKLRISHSDFYKMRPGLFIGQTLDLNKYYNLKSGEYRLYAIFEIDGKRKSLDSEWSGKLISNDISFVVR